MTEPLRRLWDDQAPAWAAWARAPDHDAFWHHTRWWLLEIVPAPGALTLDLGCGEGRLARELTARGHHVVGVDASATLARLAGSHSEPTIATVADLAALPVRDAVADVAVACMSLQDVDDLQGSVREAARALAPHGRFSVAIVHPINSAGRFRDNVARDSPFVIEGSYLSEFRYSDEIDRDGLAFTFHSMHRPLEAYARALEESGLLIETIREPPWDGPGSVSRSAGWHRVPIFCFLRGLKPG